VRRRQKMTRKRSRKDFSKKSGSHKKNYSTGPMRGGIRL